MFLAQCCCAEGPNDGGGGLPEDMLAEAQSAMTQPGKEDKEQALNEVNGESWPVRFHVNVERNSKSFLGMDLSAAGPVLMVSSIAAGESLIGAWNKNCADAVKTVDKFDRLVSVNGFSGAKGKDTLDKLKVSMGQLVLVFERPNIFDQEFEVSKGEGLGLALSPGPTFILINSVQEGPVQRHNATAPKEQQIKLGSRVLEVNGQKGSGQELFNLARGVTGTNKLKFVTWS